MTRRSSSTIGLALAMSLVPWGSSGCGALRSRATPPGWPLAECPAETVTLPDPPIQAEVMIEGEAEPRTITGLTDESWAVLLPWISRWKACARDRGNTIRAINGEPVSVGPLAIRWAAGPLRGSLVRPQRHPRLAHRTTTVSPPPPSASGSPRRLRRPTRRPRSR